MVGSIVIFPPDVSGPPWTDVLTLLFTSLMESVAWTTILPPLAWLASVVTELFIIVNWFPAFTVMFPALPLPELVAEIEAPLLS